MRYRTYVGCVVGVVLTGCWTGEALHAGQTETEAPSLDRSLKIELSISTNMVAVGSNVLITATLVNTGKTDVALDRNAFSIWLSFTDAQHQPIREILVEDILCEPDKVPSFVVPGEGGKVVRVFSAKVKEGTWTWGGKYTGVGLVMGREAGTSCYPLEKVPGEYLVRGHARMKTPGVDAPAAVKIMSGEMKLSVTK